jgi:hypothetical protein
VADNRTKWILLLRQQDQSLFLVLQTWNKADTDVTVNLDTHLLGFTPVAKVWDIERDTELSIPDVTAFKVELPGPYGTRMLKIGAIK